MDYFNVVVRHCTLYEKNSVEFVYAIRILTYHLDSKNLKFAIILTNVQSLYVRVQEYRMKIS